PTTLAEESPRELADRGAQQGAAAGFDALGPHRIRLHAGIAPLLHEEFRDRFVVEVEERPGEITDGSVDGQRLVDQAGLGVAAGPLTDQPQLVVGIPASALDEPPEHEVMARDPVGNRNAFSISAFPGRGRDEAGFRLLDGSLYFLRDLRRNAL